MKERLRSKLRLDLRLSPQPALMLESEKVQALKNKYEKELDESHARTRQLEERNAQLEEELRQARAGAPGEVVQLPGTGDGAEVTSLQILLSSGALPSQTMRRC